MKKYIIIAIIAIAIMFLGIYTSRTMFGATSGTLHMQPERFLAGFGGAVWATTTVAADAATPSSSLLKEADLLKYSVFEVKATIASTTFVLPATSTLTALLKNSGDTQRWIFQNAQTTTGIIFTLFKGTGWDLTGFDNDDDLIAGAAVGSEVYMSADCTRKSNKDIVCLLNEYVAAD